MVFLALRKKNDPVIFFAISWFIAALLPVSNLYPINAYMAEHWLYLPSIGFFLMIGKFFCERLHYHTPHDKWIMNRKIIVLIFAICLSAFYCHLTIRQNIIWRDPIRFYERTLQYAPNSPRVHYNLGIFYNKHHNRQATSKMRQN